MTEFEQQVSDALWQLVDAWASNPQAGDIRHVLVPRVLAPRVAGAIEAASGWRSTSNVGRDAALRVLRGSGETP